MINLHDKIEEELIGVFHHTDWTRITNFIQDAHDDKGMKGAVRYMCTIGIPNFKIFKIVKVFNDEK